MVNPFVQYPLLSTEKRGTHTYIIGQPGTGKSRLMESWIMQDIQSGQGICVIDPHGDLFQNILARVAQTPSIWGWVLIIDPCSPKWAVQMNPLKAPPGVSAERVAWFLTDIILKIWKLKPNDAPRMTWLMANTFSALSELRLPITSIPRFLIDTSFRNGLVNQLGNESTKSYFQMEFPKSEGGIHQWVTPLLNKLGSFLHDPDISVMFSETKGIDFREILRKRRIVLVHIPKGILGENTSNLLGAFIVAQIQQAALSRMSIKDRHPYYLYLDEFQNYTADNISDILSESRKYALSMVLAHQYLEQLDRNIQAAVLNTSGSIAAFRTGYDDALKLAKHIFPTKEFATKKKYQLEFQSIASITFPRLKEEKENGGWDKLAYFISNQINRQFWIRVRTATNPLHLRSHTVSDLPKTKQLQINIQNLIDTSGSRYARLKSSKGEYRYAYQNQTKNQTGSNSFWSR